MKPWEARLNVGALAATAVTGAAYGGLKYFVPARDPDSNMAVPWQPAVLKSHVLVAPLLVFGLGLLFRRHALKRLRIGMKRGRRTGVLLLAWSAPAVFSGYAVQALAGEEAARYVGWGHAALGVLFTAGWLIHLRGRSERGADPDELLGPGPDDGEGDASPR